MYSILNARFLYRGFILVFLYRFFYESVWNLTSVAEQVVNCSLPFPP